MTNKLKLSAAALFSAIALGGGAFTTATTVFAAGDPADTATAEDTSSPTDPKDTTDNPDPTTGKEITEEVPLTNNSTDPAKKDVTATGHAYVSFTTTDDEGPWDPGDPKNPDDDNNKTGDTGYLRLVAIPSVLNFGNNKITGGDQTMTLLHGPSDKDRASVATGNTPQTTDGTGNSDVGGAFVIGTQVMNVDPLKPEWHLSAKLSDFSDGTNKLTGASIKFSDGIQQGITTTNGNRAWTKLAGDEGSLTEMTLIAGGGAESYKTSKATGATQQIWKDSNVELTVPGDQIIASSFTANIDWNLSASPITPAKTDAAAPAAATTTTGDTTGDTTE